jgi:energy-coupling factor transporter ATP-binding protein EcfA2
MTPIVLDRVSFAYEHGRPAIDDLTWEAEKGSFQLLLGPNGSGKSTLLNLLNGIHVPQKGMILINGRNLAAGFAKQIAGDVSVTFQNPGDQLFASTVIEEASFAPRNLRRSEPTERSVEALRLFGLESVVSRHPYDLLPAQRKLLTLASAVASGASILAFDEPSAGLSQPERGILLAALRSLRREGFTMVIASHDAELFLPHADRVLVLANGRKAFSDNANALLAAEEELRRHGIRFQDTLRLKRILSSSVRV